jgi:hypothetical protein
MVLVLVYIGYRSYGLREGWEKLITQKKQYRGFEPPNNGLNHLASGCGIYAEKSLVSP